MESSPEGLLSRVSMVGREDEIQPYTGLVFLRIPALSDDAPGLLSLHVTAAGTWEPFLQIIAGSAVAPMHPLTLSSHVLPRLLGCCAREGDLHSLPSCLP